MHRTTIDVDRQATGCHAPLAGSDDGGRRLRWNAPSLTVGRRAVVAGLAVILLVLGISTATGVTAPGRAAAAASPQDVAAVESLYAQDLVARINAERAARTSSRVPIPQLQVAAELQAAAQAWSAHLAAIGRVQDPGLSCSGPGGSQPSADQICAFAANSGESGNGFWPGDGSDGMNADYMNSPYHRQNQLGAAYSYVGVGVTCSGGQAWTVELFGYAYGTYPSANARQATQNAVQGQPVPASPQVAGTQSGDPVYCPGQQVGADGQVTATGGQYPYPYAVPAVPGEPNAGLAAPAVGIASLPDGKGYWVARADGAVTAHGAAHFYGSMDSAPLNAPITHVVATPDGGGYWLVGADGGIFTFGDARFYGSMGGQHLNAPIVDLAPTADGRGYWLVGSDGGVFAFGDAGYFGSMGGAHLNQPVVGMAPDDRTGGYWLVASDGGVFSFNAPFYGSTGNLTLHRPVNGMAATPDGSGYWFVASDGGIFAFGDAAFRGSAGAVNLNAPVVGMAADPASGGYWLVGADGGVFAYGAPFLGAG